MALDPEEVDRALGRISAHRREGMTDAVHRFLVTPKDGPHLDMWAATAAYTNWLEGRPREGGGETWLVMVMGVHEESFLAAARACGFTVEELQGIDPRPILRVGEPGTGWAKAEATHGDA